MSHRHRTHLLAAGLTAVALPLCVLAVSATVAVPAAPSEARALAQERPLLHVVSMPDFLNADLADVSVSPLYQPGAPNSWNESIAAGIDTVLDAVEAEHPEHVLMAGDLVEGHWGVDVDGTGTFGPVDTTDQKRAAIRRAADLYYSAWQRRFADRRLSVLPAIGDHELGDNNWSGTPQADFKRSAFGVYKSSFVRKFTMPGGDYAFDDHPVRGQHHDSAYAVRLAPEVLLVTVDPFKLTSTDVELTVDGPQLAWLDGVLGRARAAGIDWVVVQEHVPVLGPVRYRHSSDQHLSGRASSAFWRTLVKHRVDLLLTGEAHDTSMIHQDGVTQVTHGGMFTWGQSGFVTATFFPDRVELVAEDLDSRPVEDRTTLWATSSKRSRAHVDYLGGTHEVGHLALSPDQEVLEQSGKLLQYSLVARMQEPQQARTLAGSTTFTATSDPAGAEFQLETRVAVGSAAFELQPATDWSTSETLVRPVGDGDTVCARAVARHPVNELTSRPSSWRCAAAPYDDRALERRTGSTTLRALPSAFHGTATELVAWGTRARGPAVTRLVDRVSVRARTGPDAGRLAIFVGDRLVRRVDLTSSRRHLAWFGFPTEGRTGRVVVSKTGVGEVLVDAVELRRHR